MADEPEGPSLAILGFKMWGSHVSTLKSWTFRTRTGPINFHANRESGVDEYDITIKSLNHSITYQSIGGVDTRDYNSNVFTNTIANTTTPFFDNGQGQRLDIREFNLTNAGFESSGTTTDFIITQKTNGLYGDNALFSGLTFSDAAPTTFGTTPEPSTWAMMMLGFAGIGAITYRRRKSAALAV